MLVQDPLEQSKQLAFVSVLQLWPLPQAVEFDMQVSLNVVGMASLHEVPAQTAWSLHEETPEPVAQSGHVATLLVSENFPSGHARQAVAPVPDTPVWEPEGHSGH
jgi:hypothetical protein